MFPIPMSEISSRLVTCHGDFHCKNLINNSDNRKIYAIDFEFTCVDFAISDISYALMGFIRGSKAKKTFIKTYLQKSGYDSSDKTVETVLLDAELYRIA